MRTAKHLLLAAFWSSSRSRRSTVASSAPRARHASAPLKAAWIYVGPAQRRRLVAGARRGPAVRPEGARHEGRQTTYKENVPEGPQISQVIDSLVRDGNKIIFATSFGFQDRDGCGRRRNTRT